MESSIKIGLGTLELSGILSLPASDEGGLVLFVHGSGSGRNSPRNRYVAGQLLQFGLATLLFDLLTEEEEVIDRQTGHLRFDIPLLASRLELVTNWLMQRSDTKDRALGYFGASTGAAAALVAAAWLNGDVKGVVSRGGRPDLAGNHLPQVSAPTLFIVGSRDTDVLELNRKAMARMRPGLAQLEIVSGAGHLFEEPGALEQVSNLAARWFRKYLLAEFADEFADSHHDEVS